MRSSDAALRGASRPAGSGRIRRAFLPPLGNLLAVIAATVWCVAAHAQSADRAGRIDEIVGVAAQTGFPHLLGDAVPMALRYGLHEDLPRLGLSRQLGADWKPGNAWYRRAAREADRAADALARRVAAQSPDWEKPLRDALESVKDGELDGLVQLYRSPAAPLLLELADTGVSLFILASLETQRKTLGLSATAMPVMRRLSDRIGELGAALRADQRVALTQYAPGQALKTMATMHEQFFRNTMHALQPALDSARAQLRLDLGPLLEQFDPLRAPPATRG
jgi:hypothetical protein